MSRKNQVTFTQPDEPAFILRMKQQIGWKEGPNVDTKRECLPSADEPDYEREEPEDEKPAVVTLRTGDLTAEEVDEVLRDQDLDDKTPGRFRFRKPVAKQPQTTVSSSFRSSSKRPLDDTSDGNKSSRSSEDDGSRSEKRRAVVPAVNQRQLLSFADDEESE